MKELSEKECYKIDGGYVPYFPVHYYYITKKATEAFLNLWD